jgi:hypothetical protein
MQAVTGLEDFFPQERLQLIQIGREDEIRDMLSLLGYIEEGAGNLDIDRAITQFRLDAFAENLFQQFLFSFEDVPTAETLDFKLNPIEHKALSEMTSLEGDFICVKMPPHGQITLSSRIIRYRLKVLALSDQEPAVAFAGDAMEALGALQDWLEVPTLLDAANISGNVPGIINIIVNNRNLNDRIVYYRSSDVVNTDFLNLDKLQNRQYFQRSLALNLPKRSAALKSFVRSALDKDLDFLNTEISNPINSFHFRVLQVHQWMAGFSHVNILDRSEELTFNSVLEFHKLEVEADNREQQILDVTAYIANGIWVFNIMYYFKRANEMHKNATTLDDVLEEFRQQVGGGPASTDVIEPEIIASMDDLWKDAVADQKDNNRPHRFYHGAKTLVKAIGRVLKRVFRWFRDKVKDLFEWLKSVARVVYKELREGIKVFAHGMKYLFGRRELITGDISASILVTKYNLDSDASLFSSGADTQSLLKEHAKSSAYFGSSLNFSLTLTGKVIHWAIALASGGGWLEVLVKIAQVFHEMVKEWLKKKKADGVTVAISY